MNKRYPFDGIRLIQRLEKPTKPPYLICNIDGFTEKASKDLKKIMGFDYMGSAEFEWQAVPKAFQKIKEYHLKNNGYTNKIILENKTEIPYICEKGLEQKVETLIRQLAENERKINLKEYCGLKDALKGVEHAERFSGWLELQKPFMFFIDDKTYKKTLKLFNKKSFDFHKS